MTTDIRDARGLPEEDFHEIQLSGKQLVFLFMATTVVSVVIFLCGVLVGRGVRPSVQDGSAVSATSESLPADATAANLPGASVPAEGGTEPADAPAGATQAQPPSYYRDLTAEQPAPEAVTPASENPTVAPERPSTPAVAAGAAAPVVDARQASSPTGDQPWIVQVTALKRRAEAQAIARRLVSRGYQAFVLDPQPGTTALYRVRVGPFTDRTDAEQTMKRLSSEEQFKPWISR